MPKKYEGHWTPEHVKELRTRLGWSQERMASELHVAGATIRRWESGSSHPSYHLGLALDALDRRTPA